MKAAGIVLAVIVLAIALAEIVSKVASKRHGARWRGLSPDERRKCQESMRKARLWADSAP